LVYLVLILDTKLVPLFINLVLDVSGVLVGLIEQLFANKELASTVGAHGVFLALRVTAYPPFIALTRSNLTKIEGCSVNQSFTFTARECLVNVSFVVLMIEGTGLQLGFQLLMVLHLVLFR